LGHAHLTLFGSLLRARERYLLLGSDGLRFDFTQKLFSSQIKSVSSLILRSLRLLICGGYEEWSGQEGSPLATHLLKSLV
jgi:hypothetical protein